MLGKKTSSALLGGDSATVAPEHGETLFFRRVVGKTRGREREKNTHQGESGAGRIVGGAGTSPEQGELCLGIG